MSDYRTVINGRVGWDGAVYSHRCLWRFEGREVEIDYLSWGGVTLLAAGVDMGSFRKVFVLEAV